MAGQESESDVKVSGSFSGSVIDGEINRFVLKASDAKENGKKDLKLCTAYKRPF